MRNKDENDLYIEKGGRKLRCGYTTGSCAAAAAKAALIMLLEGNEIENVTIQTPNGHLFVAEITDIQRNIEEHSLTCAVTKDAGDEPDVTDGIKIFATVSLIDTSDKANSGECVTIEGGKGIGTVTRPGLTVPVGCASINPIPKEMIRKSLCEILKSHNLTGRRVKVVISAPDAASVVEKTYNPKMGIIGGITILGNTGIIEPLSNEMVLYSLKSEISIRKAEGETVLLLSPGGCGIQYLADRYGVNPDLAVLCYNFVRDAVLAAREEGFDKILMVGRMGKLVKVSEGAQNTHPGIGADRRMEIIAELTRLFVKQKTPADLVDNISRSRDFDNVVRMITEAGLRDEVFAELAIRIKRHMDSWTDGKVAVEVVLFNNDETELKATRGAEAMVRELAKR